VSIVRFTHASTVNWADKWMFTVLTMSLTPSNCSLLSAAADAAGDEKSAGRKAWTDRRMARDTASAAFP